MNVSGFEKRDTLEEKFIVEYTAQTICLMRVPKLQTPEAIGMTKILYCKTTYAHKLFLSQILSRMRTCTIDLQSHWDNRS